MKELATVILGLLGALGITAYGSYHVGYKKAWKDVRPYVTEAVTKAYYDGVGDGAVGCAKMYEVSK